MIQRKRSDTVITTTVAKHLIQRLEEVGVRHIFGVPGDYALQFYAMLEASPINVVGTTREDCAGFAADAYARQRYWRRLCYLLCRRVEPVQFCCGCLCREITADRHQWGAGGQRTIW